MATEEEREKTKETGPNRKIIIAIVCAALFCLAIVGGVLLYDGKLLGHAARKDERLETTRPGPVYSFEPFVVNIAGTHAARYLRTCVSVECASKKALGDITRQQHKVRDAILEVLSAQTLEGLLDVSRRDDLRRQISIVIERALSGGVGGRQRVRAVYFSEYAVQ